MFRFLQIGMTLAICVMAVNHCSRVAAQSYTDSTLNSIRGRNSAAQYSVNRILAQNVNRAITPTGVAGLNLRTYAGSVGSLSSKQKPFANLNRGPSVSPYLALDRPFASASDYYSVIRPMQEQRQLNQRMARQQYAQEKRLNQIAAQGPYSIQGDEDMAPTGHAAVFMQFGAYMNTGSYFAPPTRPKGDR